MRLFHSDDVMPLISIAVLLLVVGALLLVCLHSSRVHDELGSKGFIQVEYRGEMIWVPVDSIGRLQDIRK